VYIAALPGKKGGGCLSDQAGQLRQGGNRNKLARHFKSKRLASSPAFNSRQRQGQTSYRPLHCLTVSEDLR